MTAAKTKGDQATAAGAKAEGDGAIRRGCRCSGRAAFQVSGVSACRRRTRRTRLPPSCSRNCSNARVTRRSRLSYKTLANEMVAQVTEAEMPRRFASRPRRRTIHFAHALPVQAAAFEAAAVAHHRRAMGFAEVDEARLARRRERLSADAVVTTLGRCALERTPAARRSWKRCRRSDGGMRGGGWREVRWREPSKLCHPERSESASAVESDSRNWHTPAFLSRQTKGGRARACAVCHPKGTRVPTWRSFDSVTLAPSG